jgi:hypothetical protein
MVVAMRSRWASSRAVLAAGAAFAVGCSFAMGCSPAAPPPPSLPVPTATPKPPPSALPSASAGSTGDTALVTPTAPEPPPPPPVPPPKFAAPYEKTAQEGDGVWEPLIAGPAGQPALMYKAIVHPHPQKKPIYAAIVAIDLTRTDVTLVAGTEEPETKTVAESKRTGLVPATALEDLLVVMNGGFMAKHGNYGMMLDGEEFLTPREDACAVAKRKDGSLWIAPWLEMKGKNAEISFYRQTPACLVDKGALHPDLDSDFKRRKWGGQNNGQKDTRRSAMGVDASGKVLFYGLGEWVFPKDIAVAMKAAGAVSAAELDINWSYTRFLVMGHPTPSEPVQVLSTLVPKIEHSKRGYVEKAATRDFFYVTRKRAAPAAAPVPAPAPGMDKAPTPAAAPAPVPATDKAPAPAAAPVPGADKTPAPK